MVTVSILGAGFMGGAHAANYRALGDGVRVKTVCGRSADRAAKVAAMVGAEPSTDLNATIAAPEIDAVDDDLQTGASLLIENLHMEEPVSPGDR